MMLLKCYTRYVSKFPIPKQGSSKKCSNHQTAVLISHASKVILKIHQARLQHYMNQELPDVQAGFRKGRGTRDQIANIHWIKEKVRNCRGKKKSSSVSLTTTVTTPKCQLFIHRLILVDHQRFVNQALCTYKLITYIKPEVASFFKMWKHTRYYLKT